MSNKRSFHWLFFIITSIIHCLLFSNASLLEGHNSDVHRVVKSLASIPQHSFNIYQPAYSWNETFPYHLLRAGLPSHEIRYHPGVTTEDNNHSEPFYLAFTDFRNQSFGNHLGIYFEILSCALETDTPIVILFPFHFEPLRVESDANIETFLSFLPSSFFRGDDNSSALEDGIEPSKNQRRLLPSKRDDELTRAQKKLSSVCVCGDYCWGNPRSLWVKHLGLIRNITRTALDKSLISLEQAGILLRDKNNSSTLTYEVGGRWRPLVCSYLFNDIYRIQLYRYTLMLYTYPFSVLFSICMLCAVSRYLM
jgi:hypothetical protein